jgi:hypothetical protein
LFTFREARRQVSPVTMSDPSLKTASPPCLPLDIKDLLLAFGMWEAFGREDCWREIAEGGNEWLKENC